MTEVNPVIYDRGPGRERILKNVMRIFNFCFDLLLNKISISSCLAYLKREKALVIFSKNDLAIVE